MYFDLVIPTLFDLVVIASVMLVLFLTYKQQKAEYKKYAYLHTYYPWKMHLFFAPVYEELLFRLLILIPLIHLLGFWASLIISSVLFGLWHIRNIKYQPYTVTVYQCLYTGIVLGPLLGYVTIGLSSIYLAILVHALNNYLSPLSQELLKKIRLII